MFSSTEGEERNSLTYIFKEKMSLDQLIFIEHTTCTMI